MQVWYRDEQVTGDRSTDPVSSAARMTLKTNMDRLRAARPDEIAAPEATFAAFEAQGGDRQQLDDALLEGSIARALRVVSEGVVEATEGGYRDPEGETLAMRGLVAEQVNLKRLTRSTVSVASRATAADRRLLCKELRRTIPAWNLSSGEHGP